MSASSVAPVVLYLFSTSNHNSFRSVPVQCVIVLYLFSTSNHNPAPLALFAAEYCLISLFYIKPQLRGNEGKLISGCLISLFYIKPQLRGYESQLVTVVLYLFSTSNHNRAAVHKRPRQLSYISFLHQTTTSRPELLRKSSCLISLFYIKPQP